MRCFVRRILFGLLTAAAILSSAQQTFASEIEFQVNIGEIDRKTESANVDESQWWFLRCHFSGSLQEAEDLTVLQTLSPELSLNPDSVCVQIIRDPENPVFLEMSRDYDLTAGSVFVEKGTSDRIRITLTQAGIELLSALGQETELRIAYQANINKKAQMGFQILGSGQLNFTDKGGYRTVYLSDKAVTSTGGFPVRLTDQTGTPLVGGKFMVAREANREELVDPNVTLELLDIGSETIVVVYETFFTSKNMSNEKTDIAVTDQMGCTGCYGLAYGTYYLVQTESVREDLLSSGPVKVIVNEASHLTPEEGWTDGAGRPADNTVQIRNSLLVMPQTGGTGTLPYTASGIAVIFCAIFLLWNNRNRRLPLL